MARRLRPVARKEAPMSFRPDPKDSLTSVQDLVLYELAPYLNRRGAHAWVEVSRHRFVVGFTCWLATEREALRTWVHDRLRAALTERAYQAITVDDRSA
jgi:hypothetical protein